MTNQFKNKVIYAAIVLSMAALSLPAYSGDVSLGTGGYNRAMHDMGLMKMIDGDGDHTVTNAEYTSFYEDAFNKLDKNGDGSLDSKEWIGTRNDSTAMVGTGGYNRQLRKMEMMKKMDTDGDHKVTKEEFLAFHQSVFNAMDKGSSGQITAQQWAGKFL
jgi:hypothetical protein